MAPRSASTAMDVSLWFSAAVQGASASTARVWIARAPWPGAGRKASRDSFSRITSDRPSRFRPETASRMASKSPSAARRRRVSTLPRSISTFRSGRRARAWAWRRRLAVPSRAPVGRSSNRSKSRLMKASRGSSRSGMAAMTRPSGCSAGTSFIEWTAASMRPASRASSISLVNRALPPISSRRRSCTRSPVVTISTSSTRSAATPRAAATARCIMPDWASASRERRVPMRRGSFMDAYVIARGRRGRYLDPDGFDRRL